MLDFLKRWIWVSKEDGSKVEPLILPFLFCSFVYGIGMMFFGSFYGVSSSSLYQAFNGLHHFIPPLWGAFLVVVVAGVGRLFHDHKSIFIGSACALIGTSAWIFAAMTYLLNGDILVFLAVGVTNTFFWIILYFRLSACRHMRKE